MDTDRPHTLDQRIISRERDYLRILLVSSSVTYVRDNYDELFRRLAQAKGPHLVGLLLIETVSWKLWGTIINLFFAGCFGLARNLLVNIFKSWFDRQRETLFSKVYYSPSINERHCVELLRSLDLDLIINLRTRNIYKSRVLNIPRGGCLNVHHGLLPENRGTMCDLWALYEDRPVGFTIHYMNKKIDDGDIVLRETLDLKGCQDYSQIPYLSSLVEAQKLIEIINTLERGEQLPTTSNQTANIRYTQNPTLSQIFAMKKKGLRL